MRKYFLAIFLVLIYFNSTFLHAQTVTGRVINANAQPVPFSNISVIRVSDSTLMASAISDSLGRFEATVPSTGNYNMVITAIGYQEVRLPAFEISTATHSKYFGDISLHPDQKTLKNVTVQSLRPTITQLADRMVVNVEGTAMAAGNTAYDVLSKAPGVFIDQEGNIQLNGRSGVTVMIDGRLTYLSARDLRTLLEGMPAENIRNLEIITNPSAKYDAEGATGILNINLRKNTVTGMNGSVYTSYNYNFKQHGYSLGGNLNAKTLRWNSFLNIDMANRAGGREATFTRIFKAPGESTYFDQAATGNFRVQGPPAVRLGTDYTVNDKSSIGFMVYYNTNKARSDFLTDTYIGTDPAAPSQLIEADNYNRNTYKNFTSNIHFTSKLDTLGSTFSTDVDYVRITNRGDGNFYNYFTDMGTSDKEEDFLYTHIPNGYDIYSARADFIKHLKNGQVWEAGAKASRVISDNDSRFYFNNNGLVLDPNRTNHFNYKETILAAYVNWKGKISKTFSFQAGLRAENTSSAGNLITTGQVNKRDYFDLFPSLFIQQSVNANYGINYSYSRRLTRPNYGNLNPFRYYRDPYTWVEGNPFLRPQYTHSFSIAQVIKKLYNLTISYQLNKDVMSEIPILDVAETTTVYTTGNMDNGHSIGFTGVAPVRIMKKWDSQNTVILSYNKFNILSNNGPLVNDQLFFMVQSNHTIQLAPDLRMELNLLFRGPAAYGLYQMASMHRVDIAFKKSFLDKKFELSVNANDLFKGYRFFWKTDINGNVNDFDQYFRFRAIGISLRYNFSKGQKVETRNRNAVEEVNRI